MRSWNDFVSEGHIPAELVHEKPIIALYGSLQNGKSTLINCFMGRYTALTGKGLATTSLTARYRYAENERIQYRLASGDLRDITLDELFRAKSFDDISSGSSFNIEAKVPAEILKFCDIVDTPGFNANNEDTAKAWKILENVNYCLFVISNTGLTELNRDILKQLCKKCPAVSIIMNCSDGRRQEKWLPSHPANMNFINEIRSWINSEGLEIIPLGGKYIFSCNALFYWSQQKDFEKSKAYINQADTVHKHIAGLLKDEEIVISSENILSLSRINELISALEAQIKKYNPANHQWRK